MNDTNYIRFKIPAIYNGDMKMKKGNTKGLFNIIYIVGNYKIFILAIIFNIVEGISRSKFSYYMGDVLDDILGKNSILLVYHTITAFICVLFLFGGIWGKDYLLSRYLEKGMKSIRKKVMENISNADFRWLDSWRSGELMSRITNDLNSLGDALRPVLILGITGIISAVITGIFMCLINPLLSAILLGFLFFVMFL